MKLRFLQKKLIDFVVKGVIITTVVLFLVHVTSPYPRSATPQKNVFYQEGIQKREYHEPVEVAREVIKIAPATNLKPLEPRIEPRKGSFYENVIVHFDLKGAPPKLGYFLDLLRLISKAGATGILLEWEDTFPWSGVLEQYRSTNAYSVEDVGKILSEARKLKLDIIPLVQTFGHLEWILKYEETRKLRENDKYPQVVCLGDSEGIALVKEALKQVIETHSKFGIPYFHIGADEAFEFGVCEKSLKWMREHNTNKQELALSHLHNISIFVKETAGKDTTVLAWHDMLKTFDEKIIKSLDLGNVLQPVIWDYSENIVTMDDWSFDTLARNFPTVWASSAYKGANFPSASLSDVRHYEANNLKWIETKSKQQRKFRDGFRGIIITGWQRYDHLAGLCEILPVGTPSMVLQVQTALNAPNMDQSQNRQQAGKILECQGFHVAGLDTVSNSCRFPGSAAYQVYQNDVQKNFNGINQELGQNHHLMGWANRYNRRYNISQNWYHSEMRTFVNNLVVRYSGIEEKMRDSLKPLFDTSTVEEFIYENLGEMGEKLHGYAESIERLDKIRTWPKREFSVRVTENSGCYI